MRIAINIADLTREPHTRPGVSFLLLDPVTPNRILVNADPSVLDGNALILECDENRARAIAETFRKMDDKRMQYRTRVYFEGARGGWRKATAKETIWRKP